MNQKLWFNEEKAAIVLEIVRGGESAVAVCTRYGVSATQAYRWLDRFLEGGRSALVNKRTRRGRDPVLEENHQLKELARQQALIIVLSISESGTLRHNPPGSSLSFFRGLFKSMLDTLKLIPTEPIVPSFKRKSLTSCD